MICNYEKYLVDFINNELSPDKRHEVKHHLEVCESCAKKVEEWQIIHGELINRQRQEPNEQLFKEYENELIQIFHSEKKKSWLEAMREKLQFSTSYQGFRLAYGVAILAVGIFIGYFLTHYSTDSKTIIVKPTIVVMPESAVQTRVLNDFLVQTEVLLLSIANYDSNQVDDVTDVVINKEISQELLNQISVIKSESQEFDRLLTPWLLNNLEFIFLEISNVDKHDYNSTVMGIRSITSESKLLYQTRQLQEYIKVTGNGSI